MSEMKKHILLVEDDPFIVDILRPILLSWDYEVSVARSAFEALELVGVVRPDLNVIDTSLPDMDGLVLCQKLKENFFTESIPIIILMEKRKIRTKILKLRGGLDDYITKPPDPIDLKVRIEMALQRSEHQFYASSLTKLPGSQAIGIEMERRISLGKKFCVAYYDIDNFKSFNDRYGYIKGDAVIHQTAHIIASSIQRQNGNKDFLGHIGGDDFIVISTPDRIEDIACRSMMMFDRLIPLHYPREDRNKGYITTLNRQRKEMQFPMMSLSIAIATNEQRLLNTVAEISQVTSEIKKHLKTVSKSCYLIDRRVMEVSSFAADSVSDAESDPENAASVEAGVVVGDEKKMPVSPVGQMLLQGNAIKQDALDEALRLHWMTGQHVGEVLMRLGHVSRSQLGAVLEKQLGVPYLDLAERAITFDLCKLFPSEWIPQYKVFPVERDDATLRVAMTDPKDEKVISRIQETTGMNVEPLLVLEDDMKTILHDWFNNATSAEEDAHAGAVAYSSN